MADDTSPYNVKEVAQKLRFTEQLVRKAAREGRLPAFRVGREWRFSRKRTDRLIEDGVKVEP